MHILITDSGVGGLSVCGYAERFIRTHGSAEPVRLTFANAAPANDYGYNSMPTRKEKIETFDRFLTNVTNRFPPDLIYVACNTLSVLLHDTPFARSGAVAVKGIVGTALALMLNELEANPESVGVIFGTQTTIDAGTYARLLGEHGIAPHRIISQACPGLADVISEDREGSKTRAEIDRWVAAALSQHARRPEKVVAALACTHYGYRQDQFAAAFASAGLQAKVIDPNARAVDDLFGVDAQSGDDNREVTVQFVTRYAIPPSTLETLTFFLGEISPVTVAALHRFELIPDLF